MAAKGRGDLLSPFTPPRQNPKATEVFFCVCVCVCVSVATAGKWHIAFQCRFAKGTQWLFVKNRRRFPPGRGVDGCFHALPPSHQMSCSSGKTSWALVHDAISLNHKASCSLGLLPGSSLTRLPTSLCLVSQSLTQPDPSRSLPPPRCSREQGLVIQLGGMKAETDQRPDAERLRCPSPLGTHRSWTPTYSCPSRQL